MTDTYHRWLSFTFLLPCSSLELAETTVVQQRAACHCTYCQRNMNWQIVSMTVVWCPSQGPCRLTIRI